VVFDVPDPTGEIGSLEIIKFEKFWNLVKMLLL
jgi:hypothetical protein